MAARGRSDAAVIRLGLITMVVLLLAMAAAFNLQKFPGFRGTTYHAEFSDASGLHTGLMVQVAGKRVGRVQKLNIDRDRVVVDFEVDPGVEFGEDSRASVQVLNLLGEKYLELTPEGSGQMKEGGTIPLDHTESAYDIVGVLSDLTTTTEGIHDRQLGKALDTLSATLDGSSDEIHGSFTGLSRLSRTISSRDAELARLLGRADSVSGILAQRRHDLVRLMSSSSQIFAELDRRREAIHTLLVNARRLAVELEGVAADNQKDLGPALAQLRTVTDMLKKKRKELRATAAAVGPYANILGNIVGTGPWFDAYLVNLGGLGGEFVPGTRGGN